MILTCKSTENHWSAWKQFIFLSENMTGGISFSCWTWERKQAPWPLTAVSSPWREPGSGGSQHRGRQNTVWKELGTLVTSQSSLSYYSGSLWNSIPMGKILIFLTLCSSFPFSLFPSFISFLLTCSRGWRRQILVEMISSVRCWLLPNSVILGKPLNLSET